MSILIDETTPVVVQGMTGDKGTFHAKEAIEYGTNVVAGVTPGKGGGRHLDRPLFDTMKQAVKETGAKATITFVAPAFCSDAIMEAADAGIELICSITDGIPAQDMMRVKRYLMTQAAVSAATGILVGTVLALLGVDLALVFGLFAFLLNFIPSVGSIIATLLPLPVVLFSPDVTTLTAVLAIAIPGSIQLTIVIIITPKVMGDSLDLHPVVILLALILWGTIWGIVGMLLATPITAVMKILFERLEVTRPLAGALAGRF